MGNGKKYGIKLDYTYQKYPRGLADAFIVGESFIGNDDVCLVLGDNIFYGKNLPRILQRSLKEVSTSNFSKIFGYYVNHPERYGVLEIDKENNPISIEEKPKVSKGDYAVVGLYFYKNDVIQIAKNIKLSSRNELEITEVNSEFLNQNRLKVELLNSIFWLDTGTHEAIVEASSFIKTIENREGRKISCLEEIAFNNGWLSADCIKERAKLFSKNGYGQYLSGLLKDI